MAKPTDDTASADEGDRRSAGVLAKWIVENTDLLLGVYALRGLGAPAEEALKTVMKVRHLEKTRLSWELWERLAQNRDVHTDVLLEERIPRNLVRLAHAALRGSDPVDIDPAWLKDAASSDDPAARPQLYAIDGEGQDDRSQGSFVRARLHGPKRSS